MYLLSKRLYLTAKPVKNCADSSPLHPLYICNGEKDCPNGRDEVNCTQGTKSVLSNRTANDLKTMKIHLISTSRCVQAPGKLFRTSHATRGRTRTIITIDNWLFLYKAAPSCLRCFCTNLHFKCIRCSVPISSESNNTTFLAQLRNSTPPSAP